MLRSSFSRVSLSLVALLAGAFAVGCSQAVAPEEAATTENAIVGGRATTVNAWPGTVALYSEGWQVCGGSLVADKWVVTAGHCVDRPSRANGGIDHVVIGRTTLSQSGGETIAVKRATRHEGFNQDLDNDIALLELEQATTAPQAHILDPAQADAALATGSTVTVVGWGTTSEGAEDSSDVLRQVSVPIVSHAQCASWYSQEGVITENMVCAGFTKGGKDACQGDSGGPLFATVDGVKAQVGIVSWGDGCAEAHAPGVYTRIANYLDWLSEKSQGAILATDPPADPGNK